MVLRHLIGTSIRNRKIFPIILLVLFAADILAVFLYFYKVQVFVSSHNINSTVDSGVVFFGDYNWSTRKFGKDTERRLKHTIYLYKTGNIRHIICVGGARIKKKFLGSEEMRNYLIKNDIDAEKILYDSFSFDTKTNWYEALKIIDKNRFNKIVIISSPLHAYRISKIVNRDNIYFSAYRYNELTIYDYLSIYVKIHYEWAAFLLSSIFPEDIYLKLLFWFRNM